MKHFKKQIVLLFFVIVYACHGQNENMIEMNDMYPWCIVAYDAAERSPEERILMMKQMGFTKYAYDWRNRHLDDMEQELRLARESNIEVISVWLWLNVKRDRLNALSPPNNRIFEIIKDLGLKTTLWLSFSNNFFEGQSQEQSMKIATEMIAYVYMKAKQIGCDIALYNHRGWFGNPYNQVEIIKALPQCHLKIVYNFHHAHNNIDDFPQIIKSIKPYLVAVNLNGMQKQGPKILPIGQGDYEASMIKQIMKAGFKGPWGILGHIEDEDVKRVLDRNIKGLNALQLN